MPYSRRGKSEPRNRNYLKTLATTWTASVGIAAIFGLTRLAQLSGIDGKVTGTALFAIALLGGGGSVLRLVLEDR